MLYEVITDHDAVDEGQVVGGEDDGAGPRHVLGTGDRLRPARARGLWRRAHRDP